MASSPQWRPQPTGNRQTDEALRIFGDYIYQLRDSVVPTAQSAAVDKGAAKAIAQVTELIASGSLTPGTTPAVVVDTHAHRSIHPPSQGTFYFETDRDALYVSSANVPAVWLFVDDAMIGLLAARPADLGVPDTGFLYYATDGLNYRWNGAAWDTLDDVRGGLTLTGVNVIPKVTAAGIIGPSAVTDDGTLVTVTGRTTKLGATDIYNNWGAIPLAAGTLALGAWGDGTHSPDAATAAWGDGSGWKWSLGYSNTGTFASRYDILDTGEMRFLTVTASLPAKFNSAKGLTSGLIDLGSGSDVAGTGLTSGKIPKWDGTKLVDSAAVDVAATSANTPNTLVLRDGGGSFAAGTATLGTAACSVSVSCGTIASAGAVDLVAGDATHTGYIEGKLTVGPTRLWYIGNDTVNCTVNLENSATFVVSGGGGFVLTPANTTHAIVTIDDAQTLSSKDLTAVSNTFGLPVIQRNDSISLTGQTVTIAATPLHVGGGTAPAGIYRVSYYIYTTTAGSGGTATITLAWNDGTTARSKVSISISLSTTGPTGFDESVHTVRADGANDITIAVAVAGATGSPIFSVYATLERVL